MSRRLERLLTEVVAGGGRAWMATVPAHIMHLKDKGFVNVEIEDGSAAITKGRVFCVTFTEDALRRFPPKWRTLFALSSPVPS